MQLPSLLLCLAEKHIYVLPASLLFSSLFSHCQIFLPLTSASTFYLPSASGCKPLQKLLLAQLIADHSCIRMRMFAVQIVGFQVQLVIVALLEQLVTDFTFMNNLFRSGSLTSFLDQSNAW